MDALRQRLGILIVRANDDAAVGTGRNRLPVQANEIAAIEGQDGAALRGGEGKDLRIGDFWFAWPACWAVRTSWPRSRGTSTV
jgi:hypothetical protein